MNHVKAKKHLGQHFLKDNNIAKKIVDSLSSTSNILEIGPGTGILTKFMLEKQVSDYYLIEIDRESVEFLEDKWPELKEN